MKGFFMRLFKRIAVFLVMCLLPIALLTAISSTAAGNAVISVEDNNTAVRGGRFTVDIIISNNPGLKQIDVDLSYDRTVMRLESLSFAQFLRDDGSVSCTFDKSRLTITSDNGVLSRNGVYATATFVLDNGAKKGEYKITPTAGASGMKDAGGQTVKADFVAGTVELSCFHNYRRTVFKPTCSSEGYTEYRCTECSITYISDYVDRIAHTWTVIATEDPTCTEAGSITRRCTVCGETKTEQKGEPTGHNYGDGVVTEPTCTSQGYTTYTCDKCGKTFRDSYTPVSNHRYVKTYTEQATCSHTGFDLYACEFCGQSYQITIPTLEHHWRVTNVNASHTEQGWSLYTCTFCGLSMRGNFIEKLEYKMVWTVTVEPTCETTGIRTGVCSDGCGYTITEEIPPLGHSYGEWTRIKKATLVSKGLWQASCRHCGQTVTATTAHLEDMGADSEPTPYTLSFWKQVVGRIATSTLYTAVAVSVIGLLFVIILVAMILHAKKRRKDRSAEEMADFADEVSKAVMEDPPAPDDLPDSFCLDRDDFDLPGKTFTAADTSDAGENNAI